MKKNRILSLILTLTMLLSVVLPTTVLSEEYIEPTEPAVVVADYDTAISDADAEAARIAAEQAAAEEAARLAAEQAAAAEAQQPVVEEQQPVVEEQQLVVEEQQPVVEEQQPVVEEQQPVVEEQQAPVEEQQAPVEGQQAPVEGQQAPVEEQQAPVEGQQAPVEGQQAPVEGQQAPVEGQQAPVEEELPFVEGYVRVIKDTVVYKDEYQQEEAGVFPAEAVVYAVVKVRAAEEAYDWLKITFDTAEANAAGEDLQEGYVQFKDVLLLTDIEIEQLTAELQNNFTARAYRGNLLPLVLFNAAVQKAPEEVIDQTAQGTPEEVIDQTAQDAAEEAIDQPAQDAAEEVAQGTKEDAEDAEEDAEGAEEDAEGAEEDAEGAEEDAEGAEEDADGAEEDAEGDEEELDVEAADVADEEELDVQAADAITINTQPESSEVEEGNYFIATVEAEGSNLTYDWQFKNAGASSWKTTTAAAYKKATLKLKASNTLNGRSFRCVISDDQGHTATSDVVILTVIPPAITITQQPVSSEVEAGNYFVATVTAEGTNLSYDWQYKNAGATTWKTSTSTAYKKATLRVKATETLNGRSFRCVISDDQGHSTTSNAVIMTVIAPVSDAISITQQPVSSEVVEGEYFVAAVVAEGSNLTYDWQYKNAGASTWKTSTSTAYKKATLRVKATESLDGRSFRCVITDDQEHSVTSDEVTMTVITAPAITITQQPASSEVAVGGYFVATVAAEGDNLAYSWEYKLPGTTNWVEGPTNDYKQAQLSLLVSSADQNGTIFRCVISDGQGNSAISNEATLTIPPITITQQPESSEVVVGEYFVAAVVAEGSNLTYDWQYKNAGASSWKTSTSTAYKKATLRVKATESLDGRSFRCVISDDQGHTAISDEVTMTVITAPAITITQQPVSSEVAVGSYFVATVAAEGSNLSYSWEYKLPGTTDWVEGLTDDYKQAELSLLVSSADQNGTIFRCVISDDQGHSETSDEATLTLPAITITQQPVSSEVAVGEYFVAAVVAEGSNLTYDWQYKNAGASSWKTSTSTAYKKAALRVKATESLDGRSFRCVISDDQGHSVTSDEVTLTVVTVLTDGTFTYQINNEGTGIIVTKYLLSESAAVVPSTFQNLPIVEIGAEAFMDKVNLVSVDLPNSVKVISVRAFKNCTNLRTMTTH